MDTQKIQITETKNTIESVAIVDDPGRFLFLLQQNNITNLSDKQKVQIQKDGERYIFSLFDKNQETKFAVASYNARNFIEKFIENQKKADEHVAVQLTGLELAIIRGADKNIASLSQKEKSHESLSTDPKNIARRIKTLKEFFDDQKDESRRESFWLTSDYARSKQERDYRKMNKEEAKKRLETLDNLEKAFNKTQKKNGFVEDLDANQYLVESDLKNLSKELDKLSDNIPQFMLQRQSLINGNADITPVYDMDITRLNYSQAKKLLKIVKNYNKAQGKVTEKTELFTQEQMRARDLNALQEYLEKVTNSNIDPTLIPFTAEHKAGYNYLVELYNKNKTEYPGTSKEFTDARKGNEGIVTNTNYKEDVTGKDVTDTTKTSTETADKNLDTNKGLFSYFDNATKGLQNTSDRGQNFYKSFGNVALLAGGIFLGWKAIKSTWNIIRGKGTGKDRGRLGGAAGLLLFTAGRPQDLFKGGEGATTFNKILGWISGDKNKENTAQNNGVEGVAQAVTGASLLFGQETIGKIKDMVELGNDKKMRIKPDVRTAQLAYYSDIINNPSGKTAEEINQAKMRKEFLEKIGKDDKKGIVDFALRGVDLDREKLNNAENKDIPFNKIANEVIQRSLQLGMLMDKGGYEKTNGEVDERIISFIKTGTPKLEELEAEGVFEKAINIQPEIKTKLDAQIDALTGLTDEQKKQLREAVYQFYMDLPNPKTDIVIENKDGKLVLSTYGESTPIDISNNTIPGLYTKNGINSIRFPMKKELLRVANLTNYINSITRGLTTTNEKPFGIEIGAAGMGKRIKFDNTTRYEVWKKDTTMISNDSLENVSRQLANDDNKEAYANYLNSLQYRKGAENNESSVVVPIVPPVVIDNTETEESDVNIIEKEKLEKDLAQIDMLNLSDEAKAKIKKDYKEFYQKYPTFKTLGVELIANGNILKVKSYNKETPIDFNKNQVSELNIDFDNFEDLFKTANLTNKIRSTFENIKSQKIVDPFHQDPGFDIAFDNNSIRNWRPDVTAVSDGLWRGGLKKTAPKLTDTNNKQLYINYLNNLRLMEDKAHGLFLLKDTIPNFDTRQKVIDGFKTFYKEHPSEERDIKFEKNDQGICLVTYEQSTPIDLINKKIKDLPLQFDTYDELFKVANLINKIRSVTIDKTTDKEYDPKEGPFDTTYLGDLEFYGSQKTVRIITDDGDMLRGSDKGLTDISEKFEERSGRLLLEEYLNNRWKTSHSSTPTPQQ